VEIASAADGHPRTFVNVFGQGVKRDEANFLSVGDPDEIWYMIGRHEALRDSTPANRSRPAPIIIWARRRWRRYGAEAAAAIVARSRGV
jgi:hypothetical protein